MKARRKWLSTGGDVHGAVATITIGSGYRWNSLDIVEWTHIGKAAELISADDDVFALIIRGVGETFCAGVDLCEWENVGSEGIAVAFEIMECAFKPIEPIPVLVVAEISGTAIGAGCEIGLTCDIGVMIDSARTCMPTGQLGTNPFWGFVSRVVCAPGLEVAADLFFTGRLVDGRERTERSLVARSVSDGGLSSATPELVAVIASRPPSPLCRAKSLMHSKKCELLGIGPSFPNAFQAVEFDGLRTAMRHFLAKSTLG